MSIDREQLRLNRIETYTEVAEKYRAFAERMTAQGIDYASAEALHAARLADDIAGSYHRDDKQNASMLRQELAEYELAHVAIRGVA